MCVGCPAREVRRREGENGVIHFDNPSCPQVLQSHDRIYWIGSREDRGSEGSHPHPLRIRRYVKIPIDRVDPFDGNEGFEVFLAGRNPKSDYGKEHKAMGA
jgi:hypothetical protein